MPATTAPRGGGRVKCGAAEDATAAVAGGALPAGVGGGGPKGVKGCTVGLGVFG